MTEITAPDGARMTTTFAGSVTTVTDEAGAQRRQLTDALGRVRELHEPDSAGDLGSVANPTQKTAYEYDALDNLTKVTQSGAYGGGPQATQVREFRYNTLSPASQTPPSQRRPL